MILKLPDASITCLKPSKKLPGVYRLTKTSQKVSKATNGLNFLRNFLNLSEVRRIILEMSAARHCSKIASVLNFLKLPKVSNLTKHVSSFYKYLKPFLSPKPLELFSNNFLNLLEVSTTIVGNVRSFQITNHHFQRLL